MSNLTEDETAIEEERLKKLDHDWSDTVQELNSDDDFNARANFEEAARNDVNHELHEAQRYNDFINTNYTYEEVLQRADGIENYMEKGVQKCEDTVPLLLIENCDYHRQGHFNTLLCENRNQYLDSEDNKKIIEALKQALQAKGLEHK